MAGWSGAVLREKFRLSARGSLRFEKCESFLFAFVFFMRSKIIGGSVPKMRTKAILAAILGLATLGLQACFYEGEPDQNDWYQGRRGRWYQQQDAWRFRDVDGNEYREEGHRWEWYGERHHDHD